MNPLPQDSIPIQNLGFSQSLEQLAFQIDTLQKRCYHHYSPIEKVHIARHAQRPKSLQLIKALCSDFIELQGDRLYGDDQAIITGLATIELSSTSYKAVIIAQEKGATTEERLKHNFGMPSPEGFRKALRAMKLAEKLNLPIITFVDTPGAFPCLEAEERGQSWAIANNLMEMSTLKTPIIVTILGEGASGGALGIAIGDWIGMFENSYYSVISPEGCASILWKDASRAPQAAEILQLTAIDMVKYGIIDTILPEPAGGSHEDPEEAAATLKEFLINRIQFLSQIPLEELVERRYQRLRSLGSLHLTPPEAALSAG
jgi:acetyl-CoA carboxylase carboxyl transferase subunit alpha